MKKVVCVIGVLIMLVVGAMFIPQQKDVSYDYLRLHIRANSNLDIDQNVKYEIKNEVVKFLTPAMSSVESKQDAVDVINRHSTQLKHLCDALLNKKGFDYNADIKINNEYFPTRTYSNTTLEAGFYDAVIIELGEAKGDNWWCVMYPPLCFVNKNENSMQIKYKSRIFEWFNNLFN